MDAAQKAIRLFALIQMDEQRQQLRGFVRSNADRSALVRLSIGAANHHDHSAVSGGRKLSLPGITTHFCPQKAYLHLHTVI